MLRNALFFLLTLFSCNPLSAFEILTQNEETSALGYGNWNLITDGEAILIREFLKPKDVVFDVGGNHGEWSSFALNFQPTIQILAFEPVPAVFKMLENNLKSHSNIRLFNCALSDQIGKAVIHYYQGSDGLSGFYYREVLRGALPDPLHIAVEQTTLDAFCKSNGITKIDFIKIDTEGAEWKILQGAENLLKNHQIRALQFEYGGCYVDAKTTLKDVIMYLKKNRYIVFRIFPAGIIHIAKWESSLENYNLSNYFAICEEAFPNYALTEFPQ